MYVVTRQYECICWWDVVFSLNSLDAYVSMRLSSPMCPFTDEFLQEIVVSFCRSTLAQLSAVCSLLWSITWKKRGMWYLQVLLPELMTPSPCSPASQRKTCHLPGCGMKMTSMEDEQRRHWGVCVSSVIGCGCHVFESQLILMDTLAHIQIYSPISENFIVFQDTRCRGGVY